MNNYLGALDTLPGLYWNSYSCQGPWMASAPSNITSGLPPIPVILLRNKENWINPVQWSIQNVTWTIRSRDEAPDVTIFCPTIWPQMESYHRPSCPAGQHRMAGTRWTWTLPRLCRLLWSSGSWCWHWRTSVISLRTRSLLTDPDRLQLSQCTRGSCQNLS